MRGGRQAGCRHGPARHFSLNTLFFISFQPTNLASTPPPSLILDTPHITKVTLRESPKVIPTQPFIADNTRCFPTRENCSSSSSSGNLLSSCAGRPPSTGSTWARWGSAGSHPSCGTWQQPRAHTQLVAVIYLGSPPALGLEIIKNVNNNSNNKFLKKGFELQSTKRHHLKDSFTTFPKHSLCIWFQACKDLQKYCTEHQNEDFLIKGFASQKQNPFREKSSCAVLWEHYNFNVFVLYIYL